MSTAVITSAPAAGFGLIMSPQTIEQVQSFCLMLSKTDFVPKAFRGKPDSIMVVGAMGARLGVDVFSAMAGIADINGRPSVWGDLMLAVCQNHPKFEDCVEVFEGTPYDDTFTAICTAKRQGREPVTRRFSVIEAKDAGLWKKQGPWLNTPQRMLQMRARAFALRDTFADGLAGFHCAEEMLHTEPLDVTATATVHDEPKQGKVRKIADEKTEARATSDAPPIGTVIHRGKDSIITAGVIDEFGVVSTALPIKPEEPKLVTVPDVKARAGELWKTADGKQLVRDHMATWKIAEIKDLGEMEPEEPGNFLTKLNEIVAAHIQIKGALK